MNSITEWFSLASIAQSLAVIALVLMIIAFRKKPHRGNR